MKIFKMVPEAGLEPAQLLHWQILSLLRLPISPFGLEFLKHIYDTIKQIINQEEII